MNLIELRNHIECIRWDDDFVPFYNEASLGIPDDVFDLIVLGYLDGDCLSTYIDFELLKYCAEHKHELANILLTMWNQANSSEDCKHKILQYYKTKSQNGNLRQLWLLGYCYQCFGFDYSVSTETKNAFGPYCMVMAFECYKKCADCNFPLGVKYAFYYCEYPFCFNIAIKNSDALREEYQQKIKELHIDI